MIQVKNIVKGYGKKEVLKGISYDFHKGEVYGIAGENGAGKTTFFRCLAGMETCTGSIITPYNPFKDHLGYLPTNPIFLSRITGWEYLKLVCIARNIQEDNFDNQNVFDLPLNEYAENYSTGMKKKLAIMGVLLQKNDVFILDEPFNGVDIHSNIIITEVIKNLKKAGKTIFMSSHIFSTLAVSCDTILLLKNGKIDLTVGISEFNVLEDRMKDFVLGDKLKNITFT